MARIARVEVGRLDYPMRGEFKFFKGGLRPSVVARLSDEGGVQGWGQAVPVETWTYETVESVGQHVRPLGRTRGGAVVHGTAGSLAQPSDLCCADQRNHVPHLRTNGPTT